MCRDKRPSKWLKKNVTTVFLLSQHKGLNIEEELCHNKRQLVTTEQENKVTSQLRQREIMLRQGFLCWMSKAEGTCHDTDYCNLKNLVETLDEEVMSRQSDECHDTRRQGFWF